MNPCHMLRFCHSGKLNRMRLHIRFVTAVCKTQMFCRVILSLPKPIVKAIFWAVTATGWFLGSHSRSVPHVHDTTTLFHIAISITENVKNQQNKARTVKSRRTAGLVELLNVVAKKFTKRNNHKQQHDINDQTASVSRIADLRPSWI